MEVDQHTTSTRYRTTIRILCTEFTYIARLFTPKVATYEEKAARVIGTLFLPIVVNAQVGAQYTELQRAFRTWGVKDGRLAFIAMVPVVPVPCLTSFAAIVNCFAL